MSDHNLRHVATCCCFLRLDLPQPTAVGVRCSAQPEAELGTGLVGQLLRGHGLPCELHVQRLLSRALVAVPGEHDRSDGAQRDRVEVLGFGLPDGDGLGFELLDVGHAAPGGVLEIVPLRVRLVPLSEEAVEDVRIGEAELDHESAGTEVVTNDQVAVEVALVALQLLDHPVAGLGEEESAVGTVTRGEDHLAQVPDLDPLAAEHRLHVAESRNAGGGLEHHLSAPAGAAHGQAVRGLEPPQPVGAVGDGRGGDLHRVGGGVTTGGRHDEAVGGDDGLRLLGLHLLIDQRLELAALVEQRGEPDLRGRHAQGDRGLAGGLHHREDLLSGHRDELGVHAVLGHQHVAGDGDHHLVHLDDLVGLHPVVAGQTVEDDVHGLVDLGGGVGVHAVPLRGLGLVVHDLGLVVDPVLGGQTEEVLAVGDVVDVDELAAVVVEARALLRVRVHVGPADVFQGPGLHVGAVAVATGLEVAVGPGGQGAHVQFLCERTRRPTCWGIPQLGKRGKGGGVEGWEGANPLTCRRVCSILEDVAQSAER